MVRTIQSIRVIPNFHFDVAYLKPYREYLPDCFRIISEALRLLEEDESYRFLVEQTIVLEAYVAAHPESLDPLRRFARAGRLSVAPGMYVMPDMNHPSGESLFLQIKLGRQWLEEKLDFSPTVCWIVDPWGHHAQLPQILRAAGFTHYVFWRCMRRDVMRNDFQWRGLDGTRIHAHWLARGYSNLVFPSAEGLENALEMDSTSCSAPAIAAFTESIVRYTPEEAAGVHVIVCNGGDMTFPQASAPEAIRLLNRGGNLPPLVLATPEEALAKIDTDRLPIVDGEFCSSMQGTLTSNVWIKQRSRQLSQRLMAIEAFAATNRPDVRVDHAGLWKPVLKQQFHDIICGTVADAALDDCRAEFAAAESAMDSVLAELCPAGGEPALFNALPFARTELVAKAGAAATVSVGPLGAVRMEEARFCGPHQGEAKLPISFSTPFYTTTIGPAGYVTSLSLPGGRELVRGGRAPFGVLAMQMDYGDLWLNFAGPLNGGGSESSLTQNEADPFDRTGPGAITAGTMLPTVQETSVLHCSDDLCIVQQRGVLAYWRIRIPFVTTITLARHTPRITWRTTLSPSGRHYRIRAVFPTSLAGGVRVDEIPFGLQVREAGEHGVQHFVRLAEPDAALALLNRGTPASNAHDGMLMLTLFRSASMEYKAVSEQSYGEGQTIEADYALVPHGGDDAVTAVREGQALNTPLLPVRVAGPAVPPLMAIGAPNVLVSAVRRVDAGTFARLYECAGQGTGTTITLSPGIRRCSLATAMEQPVVDVPIHDGRITLRLRPFEIAGLILHEDEPRQRA